MAEIELKIGLNFRKYIALEKALKNNEKSIEEEMIKLIERLYSDTVSEQERMAVEQQIVKDEKEESKAAKRFAVVHLHEEDDDHYFTTGPNENLFTIAKRYYFEQDDMHSGAFSLDTLGRYLNSDYNLDESMFSILSGACQNDARISAAIQIDLERKVVNVLENGKSTWMQYTPEMLFEAVKASQKFFNMGPTMERRAFYDNLSGKEIEGIADVEEIESQTGQGLTQ